MMDDPAAGKLHPLGPRTSRVWDSMSIGFSLALAMALAWVVFTPQSDRESHAGPIPRSKVETKQPVKEAAPVVPPILLPPPPEVKLAALEAPESERFAAKEAEPVSKADVPVSSTQKPLPSSAQEVEATRPTVSNSSSKPVVMPKSVENPELSEQTIVGHGTEPKQVSLTKAIIRDGRVRLRLLEKGKGPSMEIAWPETAAERQVLYDTFVQCLAMRPALLVAGERLYGQEGVRGQVLKVSPDRISFFIRRPEGRMTIGEREALERIRSRHGLAEGTPVRLMNRSVDAAILGGLANLLGGNFDNARTIRARYALSGSTLLIRDIAADGQSYSTEIAIGIGILRRC